MFSLTQIVTKEMFSQWQMDITPCIQEVSSEEATKVFNQVQLPLIQHKKKICSL